MKNMNRQTRIALRCTEQERNNLSCIAGKLDITVAELMRQGMTISLSKTTDKKSWTRAYTKAIENISEEDLWNTT